MMKTDGSDREKDKILTVRIDSLFLFLFHPPSFSLFFFIFFLILFVLPFTHSSISSLGLCLIRHVINLRIDCDDREKEKRKKKSLVKNTIHTTNV